ncbi:MAG: hypothetical protein JSS34_08900 [Proteobacteria bacterium]|nr:hypothetical protein [Pseudomonadota bacterium]
MNVSFKRLQYLAKNMKSSEVKEFEALLSSYMEKKDEETLKNLLKLFNDKNHFYEVLYSLVHLVETWPAEIYVKTLIDTLSVQINQSPFWTDCLFNRIFNNPQTFFLFKKNMQLAPKKDLLELFDLMDKESPHHKAVIEELRQQLKLRYI